jgi:hypothetical protein
MDGDRVYAVTDVISPQLETINEDCSDEDQPDV